MSDGGHNVRLPQQLGGSHGHRGVAAGPVGGAAAPRWARRAAAAAGLLAEAAALALVVAGLLNSPLRLGLALIAFCVAVMAAWTALVNTASQRSSCVGTTTSVRSPGRLSTPVPT
jgi:hypothetical protein